jgi:hypothetical protein
MGYLDEMLAAIDNIKRVGARNISDLTSDPAAYAEKITGHLRNQNAGVAPVAAGGELTNRPMTREERIEQAMGSVDPGGGLGGAMGVVKQKGGNWAKQEMRNAAQDLYYRRPAGEHSLKPTSEEMEAMGLGKHGLNLDPNVGIRKFMAEQMPDDPRVIADKWQSGPLLNYVKNLAGTPDDPLLALGEQGISHLDVGRKFPGPETSLTALRTEAGFPARGISKGKLAKEWEKRVDSMIMGGDAKDVLRLANNYAAGNLMMEGSPGEGARNTMRSISFENAWQGPDKRFTTPESLAEDYGWVDKAPAGTRIHSLGRNAVNPLMDIGQLDTLTSVTLDALRSGELTPAQVRSGSHTVENAVRMADKLRRAKEAAIKAPDVHLDMPDQGLSVVRLNRPGQFADESDKMGHSVRGYEPGGPSEYGHGGFPAIESGKAEVYSIRDASGKPGATIEVHNDPNGARTITQIKGKFNRAIDPKFQPAIERFVESGMFDLNKSSLDQSGLLPVGPSHRRQWMTEQKLKDTLARRDVEDRPVMDDLADDAMEAWQRYVIDPQTRRRNAQ